ncbi:hypothetical protein OG225_07190 [Nocardia sp. NBC_01377]|uniref:hypothetical protein n=1 Tax=Nocardia sp. NBC_01377 TaxID=2903595 RepID=UPI00324D64FD
MRVVADRSELRSILARATGVDGKEHDRRAPVYFAHGVVSAQRMSMWVEGDTVILGSWVGELKEQYSAFYSNTAAVQGLLGLADHGWKVRANLHLAYFRCPPGRRWYPKMLPSAEDYVHRWTRDLSPAGSKPREAVADPAFEHWLVDEGFVDAEELLGLRNWLNGHRLPKVDVRPSIEVTWYCDEPRPSVPAIRRAINEFLTAIREPVLP